MANQTQLDILKEGVDFWNDWRQDNPKIEPSLVGADLRGGHFARANLQKAKLQKANLQNADLSFCDLRDADIQGAVLREASLQGADLSYANVMSTDLRGANLEVANLTGVKGLQPAQLAGANLSGTTLPDAVAKFEGLAVVEKLFKNARKLFVAMILGCFCSWLAIASTSDALLLTNANYSPLPGIQIPIPIAQFYLWAPVVLLFLYFCFHFYMLRVWDTMSDLPAFLPDGTPLNKIGYPWLLNGLVRSYSVLLKEDRPPLHYLQAILSTFLAWWAVPITLFLFWIRYLFRHDPAVTHLQLFVLFAAIVLSFILDRLAAATLSGKQKKESPWKAMFRDLSMRTLTGGGLAVLVAFFLFWSASNDAIGSDGLLSHLLAANFVSTDVSIKPEYRKWQKQDEPTLMNMVRGASLKGTNLRYTHAMGAFLAKADLRQADLRGADLVESDLQSANLQWAFLEGASLWNADLQRANLQGAALQGVSLAGADLQGADLRSAQGLTVAQVKAADHWQLAFYSEDFLKELNLPPDHNAKLEASLQTGKPQELEKAEADKINEKKE